MTTTAPRPRVVTFGEALGLVRSTRPGGFRHVRDAEIGFGGAEANVAIGLSRLGMDVTWIGRLGDDTIGDLIERELRAEAVTAVVVRDLERSTALMLKEHRLPGTTQVRYYRTDSAGSALTPDDLERNLPDAPDLLHVTGITPALSASARAATSAAVARARAGGVPVSFDVNHRGALWSEQEASPVYRELAAQARIVFAGLDEARLLVPGENEPETLAAGIAKLGPAEVVIKLGAEGCLSLVDGEFRHRQAIAVTPVDTVGAGDAFVAGYLAARLGGQPADVRATAAVAAGAFACLSAGDWEGSPTAADLHLLTTDDPVSR